MANEKALFSQFFDVVGQPVRVQLQDGTASDGILYCIDPDTDDVALLVPSGHLSSGFSVKIMLAHNVRGIDKEPPHESCGLPTLASLETELAKGGGHDNEADAVVLQQRRAKLSEFLATNFIPFEMAEDGSVRVFGGAATLREPFNTVECGNEQLLRQLQQLLDEFGQLH